MCHYRIGRGLEPTAYENENYDYEIGKSVLMAEGSDITIICCGVAVLASLEVSRELAKDGLSVRVVNMHTIKPLDREAVIAAAKETGFIITAEEHNIIGGLGSAVAEVLADEGLGVKLKRLGIPDEYSVDKQARGQGTAVDDGNVVPLGAAESSGQRRRVPVSV